jgi:hypothetical protein
MRLYQWHDRHFGPQRHRTFFGDRLYVGRHFPGIRSWGLDVTLNAHHVSFVLYWPFVVYLKPSGSKRRPWSFYIGLHAGRFLATLHFGRSLVNLKTWIAHSCTPIP